jgi:hypothetical protein
LVLPVDAGFVSRPPAVALSLMWERSADMRRWFPQAMPGAEERLRAKCAVEFRL